MSFRVTLSKQNLNNFMHKNNKKNKVKNYIYYIYFKIHIILLSKIALTETGFFVYEIDFILTKS